MFWGLVLMYIQTEEYVKKTVLNATETSLLTTLNQTLQELDYVGKAVYLPPKYLNAPETTKVYISKQKDGDLPPPEHIQKLEAQFSPKNREGILMTPPGAELARLFENTLETSFTRTNIKYLQENLPKLLIENLEIASKLEVETTASKISSNPDVSIQFLAKHDKIHVKITSPVFKHIHKENTQFSNINETFGSPLTSAIACALAKATGKPIIIESQETGEDDETIDVEYSVLEEEQKQH